jgi:hypothetical protein
MSQTCQTRKSACLDRDEQAPILMALRPGDGDATYPAWSEHYARDVVSAEAFAYGDRIDALLAAAMPAKYVSDTRYHFFSQGGNVDLLDEVTKREAVQRADLESTIAELFRHFGAHSRNLVRGLLRASDRCLRSGIQQVDVTKQCGWCLSWVIRVVLTAQPSLPVYPDKRTFSVPVSMSQRCQ